MTFTLISIEGNIGAGKSTFVRALQDALGRTGRNIVFLEEPVKEWTKLRASDGEHIITKFYADPHRYSFPFQMVAYISRISMLRKAIAENPDGIIISERCLDADRKVFATMLKDEGKMDEFLYQIYCRWFDEFEDIWRGGKQVKVYLRADPSVCMQRVEKRAREGESLTLDYLEKCHSYHESWLLHSDRDVVVLDANAERASDGGDYDSWISRVVDLVEL